MKAQKIYLKSISYGYAAMSRSPFAAFWESTCLDKQTSQFAGGLPINKKALQEAFRPINQKAQRDDMDLLLTSVDRLDLTSVTC